MDDCIGDLLEGVVITHRRLERIDPDHELLKLVVLSADKKRIDFAPEFVQRYSGCRNWTDALRRYDIELDVVLLDLDGPYRDY